MPFFKQLYPEFQKHNQATLALEILGEKYAAHDALEDSKMLQKLVMVIGSEKMLRILFSLVFVKLQLVGFNMLHVQFNICVQKMLCRNQLRIFFGFIT